MGFMGKYHVLELSYVVTVIFKTEAGLSFPIYCNNFLLFQCLNYAENMAKFMYYCAEVSVWLLI